MGTPGQHPQGVRVSQNGHKIHFGPTPAMYTWGLLLWEWEPSVQALKITPKIPPKLYSNAMDLGNWSPPQLFELFTAGELNVSKTTWVLERVLFGLKFKLNLS